MVELTVIEAGEKLTRIALAGRLDLEGVNGVESEFTSHTVARARPTIVDLSEVELLTSFGMGMLVRAATALHAQDAGLVLLRPQKQVARALQAANVDRLTPIAEDLATALELLAVEG